MYAWTAYESVHWIAMAIGLTLFMWATFIIYLGSFTYLSDWYVCYSATKTYTLTVPAAMGRTLALQTRARACSAT